MNKKALLAVGLAIMVPVLCYLAVKYASERAVVMPKRYYIDDVVENEVDGKKVSDTLWHRTENFRLVNQLGDSVELYDIHNKIIIADFFFTRCPSICPTLTRNMQKLQASFARQREASKIIDSSVVHFLSFSVDPERDSVQALKNYADRFNANHDNWWFLTGDKKQIYDFALNEMKLGLVDGEGVDRDFIHTPKFVLLDKHYLVRGYYNGLDTASLAQLSRDVGLLMLEKDKQAPNTVFAEIVSLAWLWLIVVFLIIVFILYLRRRRKITEARR